MQAGVLSGVQIAPGWRLGVGLVLVAVGIGQIACAEQGLVVRRVEEAGRSMTYMVRADVTALALEQRDGPPERIPGVILAHGFAGSRKLMLGYAHVLAHAGYGVMSFDFSGHGISRDLLDRDSLPEEVERARRALIRQPEVDSNRIGLVGHSMGSGAVMRAAVAHPELFQATVAISPVAAEVTPETPRNLELQAGSWEPSFLGTARRLLSQAGGASAQFSTGTARKLVVVPAAEHLGILFRDASHQAVVQWLDQALGTPAVERRPYRDRRGQWWLLQVFGWVLLVVSLRPVERAGADPRRRGAMLRRPWQGVATIASPLLAALAVGSIAPWIDLPSFGGIPVGGALALWLLVAGVLQLLIGYRVDRPGLADLARGAGMFAFLWLAVGLTADLVWLQWGLVSARLWRWPLLGLACVPWFLGTEAGQGHPRTWSRPVWWLLQTGALLIGMLGLVRLVPGLRLLLILMPLLPLFTALLVSVGSRINRPWAYGVGAGLFFGWLLACSFPLVG